MSGAAPCQEPPPALAGGPARTLPWTPAAAAAAAAAAEVASETWLDALWDAAGLPDDGAGGPAPASGDQFYPLGDALQDGTPSGDQLSTQLFRNQQLRDVLLQKEVEVARLQEENQHLRQFLSSALVKRLEEKTKKLLLLQDGQDLIDGASKTGKRHRKAESRLAQEGRHPQKARRTLFADFSACQEQPVPPVDSWVLRTLGLKDVDTVDESANYSALTAGLSPSSFLWAPFGAPDLGPGEGQPGQVGRSAPWTSPADSAASPRKGSSPCSLPCCSNYPLPAKTDMAFTTSLSPHCNVKTHTFRQGQAFVRRGEDGGWKLTWVPRE